MHNSGLIFVLFYTGSRLRTNYVPQEIKHKKENNYCDNNQSDYIKQKLKDTGFKIKRNNNIKAINNINQ